MKVELTVKKEFDVKYLRARVGVRYWEDTLVNNVVDENGDLMPCIKDGSWCPLIEIETGQIINWDKGKTAEVHYKSCDDNFFELLDNEHCVITDIEGYVIDMMSPKDAGYGDYVIMDIDENGFIKDFKADFSEFLKEDD